MAEHEFHMPMTEEQVRSLRIGDHVVLQDILFGIRDATLIHMFDHARETRLDLKGHAVIHTAPNVKKVPVSNSCPAGYESICIGTTTSTFSATRITGTLRTPEISIISSRAFGSFETSISPKEIPFCERNSFAWWQ